MFNFSLSCGVHVLLTNVYTPCLQMYIPHYNMTRTLCVYTLQCPVIHVDLEIWVEMQNSRRQTLWSSGFFSWKHPPLARGFIQGKKTQSAWTWSLTSCPVYTFSCPSWDIFMNYAYSVIFCAGFCKKLINVTQVIPRSTPFLFQYSLIDKYWLKTFSNFCFIAQAHLHLTPHCSCSYHSSALLSKPLCISEAD